LSYFRPGFICQIFRRNREFDGAQYNFRCFSEIDQRRLAVLFRELDEKRAKIMLRNSDPHNENSHDSFFDALLQAILSREFLPDVL